MTRLSKRELDRALDAFEDTTPTDDRLPLDEVYPGAVTTLIQSVARDLFRIRRRTPEPGANAPEPDATERFLEVVRDRYGIDEDRDVDVCRALEDAVAGRSYCQPVEQFAIAPVTVAKTVDLETPAGESLSALVNTGREDEAEHLLVRTVYDLFADRGGHRTEVTV